MSNTEIARGIFGEKSVFETRIYDEIVDALDQKDSTHLSEIKKREEEISRLKEAASLFDSGYLEQIRLQTEEISSLKEEIEALKESQKFLHGERMAAHKEVASLKAKVGKAVEALQEIGNIIGGPIMYYASQSVQLTECEKMSNKAHDVVRQTLSDLNNGGGE